MHSQHAVAALAGDLTQRIRHILSGASPRVAGLHQGIRTLDRHACCSPSRRCSPAPWTTPRCAGRLVEHHARALWDAAVRGDTRARRWRHACSVVTPPARESRSATARCASSSRSPMAWRAARSTGRGEWFDRRATTSAPCCRGRARVRRPSARWRCAASVNKLLASRFDLEIHVNQQCQYPCGWRALEASRRHALASSCRRPLADHLWQSLLFCALGALLAGLARDNPAIVRLWLWRICALKFLVPFALVFALGGWLGFPLVHSADPLPERLVRGAAAITPLGLAGPVGNPAAYRPPSLCCSPDWLRQRFAFDSSPARCAWSSSAAGRKPGCWMRQPTMHLRRWGSSRRRCSLPAQSGASAARCWAARFPTGTGGARC